MPEDYVEQNCTFEHEGKVFEAGGARVTPEHVIGYLGRGGILTNWHGLAIGYYRVTGKWPIRSFLSSHMFQVEATVDDVVYTGRSLGVGMVYKGKRRVRQ